LWTELRAGVQFQPREVLPHEMENAEVLNDERVNADRVECGDVLD